MRFHRDWPVRESRKDIELQYANTGLSPQPIILVLEGCRTSSICSDESLRSLPVKNKLLYVSTKLRIFLCAMWFGVLCLFIRYVTSINSARPASELYYRAIYRTIELADGWDGRIITTQIYFSASSKFCLRVTSTLLS